MILNHLPRERASSLFPKDSGGKPTVPKDAYLVGDADGKLETKTPAEVRAHIGAEPTGSADAVDAKLTTHTSSRANPHGVTAAQAGAAAKSTKLSKTITTTWVGSTPPYTQNISIAGVTETSVVELSLPPTVTAAQVTAFQALSIQDGGQSVGQITLRAFGIKNTISIPITVIIRGDM